MGAHAHRAGTAGLGGGRAAPQDHCGSFGFGRRGSCACKLQVITLIRDVQSAFAVSHNSAPPEQGLSIYTHSPSLQLFLCHPGWPEVPTQEVTQRQKSQSFLKS